MYCTSCGAELTEGAKFCGNCGATAIMKKGDIVTEDDNEEQKKMEPIRIKENTIGDKLTDKIAGAISGREVETVRVSLEDVVGLIRKHFLAEAMTDREKKEVLKAATGGSFLSPYGKTLKSKDEAYVLTSYNAGHGGGKLTVLHPTDSSYVQVLETATGKAYRYYAFMLGKIKKALKAEINT